MSRKHKLRRLLIEKRLAISYRRRAEARKQLFEDLLKQLAPFKRILSFASKKEEIDLWPLNETLGKEKRLYLPKLIDSKLQAFQVIDLEHDLEYIPKWKLKEPILSRCKILQTAQIECALIPGLGFDQNRHRLGYGMGHFDRFLVHLCCPTYGIGFKEQFLEEPIPFEPHDIPLKEIFLF